MAPGRWIVVAVGLAVIVAAARDAAAQSDLRVLVWEVLVEAPPERVWTAAMTLNSANTSIRPRLDVELRAGGALRLDTGALRLTAAVIELDPPRTLTAQVVRVSPGEPRAVRLVGSRWTIALHEAGTGGTLLRVSCAADSRDVAHLRAWLGYQILLELTRMRDELSW